MAHEETGNTNGKRVATGGTEAETPTKKSKSTMTAEQQMFTQDVYSNVQASSVEIGPKAQNTIPSFRSQWCVHEKKWRAKGTVQTTSMHIL